MFKIGDIVVVQKDGANNSYFRKNDKFKIVRIVDDKMYGSLPNKEHQFVQSKYLKLYIPVSHMPNWF